jgi:TonB family protein
MKNLVIILGVSILFSQSSSSQSGPSSARLRHCSIEKDSGEPSPYPDSLKGSGIQGTVLVDAVIGTNGCAESVTVVRKLHPELDNIAKHLVSSWKFQPAMKDGHPVKVLVRIGVAFKDNSQQH